jgi:hypothetical protein
MRMLKPGFFTNDELASLVPLGRLLFAGLWTIADRSGRLEDRPLRIRAEVLPYDGDADVDALLVELADRGFILRYEANGRRYIQVVNFEKHQSPHIREPASTIPAPNDAGEAPDTPGASPVLAHDINSAEHPPSHAETETETETETESREDEAEGELVTRPPAAAVTALAHPKSLEPRYSADFEAWWSAYPRKREKVEAFAVYEKTLKAGATVDELLAAARNYAAAADEMGAEDQFIKLPATFLSVRDRPWLDYRHGVPPTAVRSAVVRNGHRNGRPAPLQANLAALAATTRKLEIERGEGP